MSPVRAFHYAYVLQNKSGKFYTGCTSDLKNRITDHNKGKSKFTSINGPYNLIYYEACLEKNDSFQREKYLKSGMGKRYLKNRLKTQLEGALTG